MHNSAKGSFTVFLYCRMTNAFCAKLEYLATCGKVRLIDFTVFFMSGEFCSRKNGRTTLLIRILSGHPIPTDTNQSTSDTSSMRQYAISHLSFFTKAFPLKYD